MKKLLPKLLLPIFLFGLFPCGNIFSQSTDSLINKESLEFFRKVGSRAAIYNGKEQAKYPSIYKYHPYYQTTEYQTGEVVLDGRLYPQVKLRLDLYTEELIIQTPDTKYNIILPEEGVDHAYIGTSYITTRLPYREQNRLPKGYFVRLYESPRYGVWEKNTSILQEKIDNQTLEYSFIQRKHFYVRVDAKYHAIRNKRALLKLFPEKRKELNRYIKEEALDFKNSPADSYIKVVQKYDQLTGK